MHNLRDAKGRYTHKQAQPFPVLFCVRLVGLLYLLAWALTLI